MTIVDQSSNTTLAAIAVLAVLVLACDSSGMRTAVDSRYSEHLTVLAREYEVAARTNAAETVGVVQIFEAESVDSTSLREISRGRLLYESRSASEIRSLFAALQSGSDQADCDLGDENSLVLVAFDRDLPRAGVARLYRCQSDAGPAIGIRPVGDAALDYSTAAAAYLEEIGVSRH